MGLFRKDYERYELPDSDAGKPQWVDLRRWLTDSQERSMQKRLVIFEPTDRQNLNASKATLQPAEYEAAILEAYVADWMVYDENGNPVPLTAAALGELPSEVADGIREKIGELRLTATDEKKASETVAVST